MTKMSYQRNILSFRFTLLILFIHPILGFSEVSPITPTIESKEWKNPFKPDKVDQAIESGIRFILNNQKDDGAIYDRGNPTAITALSVMSLAAVGHLPIHPNENGEALARALDFILLEKNQNEKNNSIFCRCIFSGGNKL